jgi:hypothetical protein
VFADLVAVRAEIEGRQAIEAKLKQTIQQAMGEADRASSRRVPFRTDAARTASGIDLKRLLADHPELATQYAITKPGSRRFLVNT